MQILHTSIPEVLLFKPSIHMDGSNYFMEHYRQDVMRQFLGGSQLVQCIEQVAPYGVVQGLHFQAPPNDMGKLVQVCAGKVLYVAVDIRQGSPGYGTYVSAFISEENKRQMWIPRGFAHGFAVLSQSASILSKCEHYFNPEACDGIYYKDLDLDIDWCLPTEDIQVSDKDKVLPPLGDITCFQYQQFLVRPH